MSQGLYRILLVLLVAATLLGGLWYVVDLRPRPGMQVLFPPTPTQTVNEEPTSTPAGISEPRQPQLVNINTATAQELETLPGIGPVLAQRIVEYRRVQGPFQRTDQLMAVEGIGPAIYTQIRNLVTVGD